MVLKKVCCFTDGFTLYHSITDLIRTNSNYKNANYLKWTNLRALANSFIKKQKEELTDVLYFSAIAYWLPDSEKRYKAFIQANRH